MKEKKTKSFRKWLQRCVPWKKLIQKNQSKKKMLTLKNIRLETPLDHT